MPTSAPETSPRTDTEAGTPPEPAVDHETLDARVESIIFSSSRPVSPGRIAETIESLGHPGVCAADVDTATSRLNGVYEQTGRSFRIEHVAGGYRVMTRPEHAEVLAAFHRRQASGRLSRAAIETLAIIAYKQPITRARLEAIRGVGCGEVLRSLLERRLIAVTGRAEELGRPMLYGTTRHFLDTFGIDSIKELPSLEAMQAQAREPS